MEEAGMRYMIFTTKHHDGFCMFDTGVTDFSIAATPFFRRDSTDITLEILEAFRDKGFMVGTYFSKPDWHCGYYWWDQYATADRHVNYDIARHPERWELFRGYTAAQIDELMTGYGPIDILWLDGDWGWVPDAPYKPASAILRHLIEITAKGGSLLLGIGPDAEGRIEPRAAEILRETGSWLKENAEAIYGTRSTACYNDGDIWFTASKDSSTLYAIYAKPDSMPMPC